MFIIYEDTYMNAEQFSKNILDLNENILFAGILEKSGHLIQVNNGLPLMNI